MIPIPSTRRSPTWKVGQSFAREEVRNAVIPAYMGLTRQIDDHLGRVLGFLGKSGRMADTMIVFTSDHGDYLGDHWMGEKELFHGPSVRVPLIIYDPDPRADATRGKATDALVEAIDLAPTFLDIYGGAAVPHIIDGRSLRPLLFGEATDDWRRHVVSEVDYSFEDARIEFDARPIDCWLRMIFDGRYKYVLAEGYRPMLYDLETDSQELVDRGADPALADVRQRLEAALFAWARRPRQRGTVSDEMIANTIVQQRIAQGGVLIGYWDEADLAETRKSWRPIFYSTNPMQGVTLSALGQEATAKDDRS